MKKFVQLVITILSSVIPFLIGTYVLAADNALPIIPGSSGVTNPNQINDIPGLISYIYNLAFWIVGIAVFFQVFRAGFIIFFGAAGSASKIAEGKKLIWNAIIGLILLFASWMILNIINPDLVKNTFDWGSLLQGGSTSSTPFPSVSNGINATVSSTPIGQNPTPQTTVAGGTCTGTACPGDTTNFCGPTSTNCSNSTINQWDSQIRSGAGGRSICGGIDVVKMLKAIMAKESGGVAGRSSSSNPPSLGLFQLKVATANNYWQRCGLSGPITSGWLLRSDNAAQQACLAAEYLKSLSSSCGCNPTYLAAGYNGGAGACQNSGSCTQCTACSNQSGATQRWQCLWDNAAHTVCNYQGSGDKKNFKQTRDYAPAVAYCYNQF